MDAVQAGVSVMLFSDNVSVEEEVLLKEEAAKHDVLVMGPDCGTAVVGGLGLGFANALRPGPVGMVAASGTGAQEVTCLLDADGVGVTAVLGVGGRDLSAAVGGRSTLAAMKALDEHAATEFIVVLSKPPTRGRGTSACRGRRSEHALAGGLRGHGAGRPHRRDGSDPCGARQVSDAAAGVAGTL